jgi:hypothetical protein
MKQEPRYSDDTYLDHLVDAYISVQRELEESGVIPGANKDWTRRLRGLLIALGGIEIGFIIAGFVLLANFVVVNMLFHFQF